MEKPQTFLSMINQSKKVFKLKNFSVYSKNYSILIFSLTFICLKSILLQVCGCGEIGRHARFRFLWETVQVRFLSPAVFTKLDKIVFFQRTLGNSHSQRSFLSLKRFIFLLRYLVFHNYATRNATR